MRFGMLVLCVSLAAQHVAARPPANPIQQVAWLQGCWEAASGDRTVEEQWMAPRGGSMVGSSRTIRGGTLAEYELTVIREQGDALVYVAHPSGQPAAQFTASEISPERIVFENRAHDFPQRIGYERKGAELRGWIEGVRDGRTRRAEFPYRRVACPG